MTPAQELTYCPACGRTDDAIGQCGRGITPCPTPLVVDPTKEAVLHCGPCDRTVVIPVDRIMKGKLGEFSRECVLSTCAATLVFQQAPAAEADPSLRIRPGVSPKPAPKK